ncbi:MAG TPA: hypothetical protein VFH70_02055 [Acidimicrobiales bacterium]|nr:hypothetical protein [Acidimicrobiales bacterium]
MSDGSTSPEASVAELAGGVEDLEVDDPGFDDVGGVLLVVGTARPRLFEDATAGLPCG